MPSLTQAERFRVNPQSQVDLVSLETDKCEDLALDKKTCEEHLRDKVAELSELQARLFAEGSQSLLLIFQGMDASGKDSTIRHMTTGVNPAGVQIRSFGVPSKDDLARSYLQRHWEYLPERGFIGIQNRSHYEEVIVTRVHPSLLSLRHVDTSEIDDTFWEQRFEDINAYEKHLTSQNNTTIVKFFLNISKEMQLKRLLKRIDNPDKRWKFDASDLRERLYWDDYQSAYNQAIAATSTDCAPWYVIPANQKYFARLTVTELVVDAMTKMNPQFPSPAADFEKVRKELLKTA